MGVLGLDEKLLVLHDEAEGNHDVDGVVDASAEILNLLLLFKGVVGEFGDHLFGELSADLGVADGLELELVHDAAADVLEAPSFAGARRVEDEAAGNGVFAGEFELEALLDGLRLRVGVGLGV